MNKTGPGGSIPKTTIGRRQVITSMAVTAVGSGITAGIGIPSSRAASKITMKLAHGATSQQSIGKGLLRFAKLIHEKTHGQVTVHTFLGGSLYSETTSLRALATGAIDFGGASNANWAEFTNAFLFMDLPYVFEDQATLTRMVQGWLGAEIKRKLADKGFELLMILQNGGFRDVVNIVRPIKVPADLHGLKMRTTASPVEQALFRHWGAIPTAINWSQVYTALSSGVIDGELVMPTWLAAAKHYEVLKYGTHEKAVIGVQTLAMMKDRFEKLPKDIQSAIKSAAADATAYSNKLNASARAAGLADAKRLGVKYYTPTAAEMKIWRRSGRDIWQQFQGKIDQHLLERIVKDQNESMPYAT